MPPNHKADEFVPQILAPEYFENHTHKRTAFFQLIFMCFVV
jgi:hypothetical protein